MKKQSQSDNRPSPEDILKKIQHEQHESNPERARGRLKLFLGFAAGVGKTFGMLAEANRRVKEHGQDVVVGFVETHGRGDTQAAIGDLEVVPRKLIAYKDCTFEEMDTDAIIARRPEWVLVDELAHTNVPGSKYEKRYMDVEDILAAGINVESTLNIQHLESLNDTVYQITGVRVRETIPDLIITQADEMVSVDITPRALVNRLKRGDVYRPEKVPQALANFFQEGNLCALREICLREVASEVDKSVDSLWIGPDSEKTRHTNDRIMVCISPNTSSEKLLRRGWRIARRLRGEIVAVYVPSEKTTLEQQKVLEVDFALADRLKVKIERTTGKNIADALAEYARTHKITEIVIGHSHRIALQDLLQGSIVERLIRQVRGIDVLVVETSEHPEED
jgi:two-component system sensor histidine kinase KdpD